MPTLINYPGRVPASLRWRLERPDVTMESPVGLTAQRQDRPGARWMLSVQLPTLKGAEAAAMRLFLQRASSSSVWFQAPDWSYERQSTPNGTPRVDGASQEGASIDLKGFTPSQVGAVRAGDRLGLTTGQVVTVLADANASGAGKLTATIDPPLRASPANDSLVYIDEPLCVFRMPVSQAEGMVDIGLLHSFAFDAIEDCTYGVPSVNYGAWP